MSNSLCLPQSLDNQVIFLLPLPLLAPLYVAVNEWQFGHNRIRFSSLLFVASPSICSISSGNVPVYGSIFGIQTTILS